MASTITAGNATNGLALSCDNTGILELKTGTGSGTTAMTIGTGQQVAVTLGSAAAPAITFAGDTNTGIFSPAADTIAFSEGGVESGRFDSSGNLLVGTTSALYSSGGRGVIEVYGSTNSLFALRNATAATYLQSFGNDFYLNNTGSGLIALSTNGAERARIDSSGKFVVGDSTATSALLGARNTSNVPLLAAFSTASSGYTDALVLSEFRNYAPNNTTARFLYCGDNASERMSVRSNGGIANFSANNVNLSDRREKTNFAPAGEWLSKICAIPVQTFNYIDQNMEEDPGETLGVVAQDVQDVAPELVMESNWGTEEEPKMRLSIYQTDLQYALMKCIQELKAELDATKAEVAALKGA